MIRSDADKKAWLLKMRGLLKQVSGLTQDQRAELARRMALITCEGHALSFFNTAFLSFQTAVPVTVIGGFQQWKKAGRQVKSGEHAIGYIYVPMIAKAKEGEEAPEAEDVRFRLVPVFDVSQTEEQLAVTS